MTAWSTKDRELVKTLAQQGVSPQRIAARVKRSTKAVQRIAPELNVRLITKTELRRSYGLMNGESIERK